MTKTLTEQWREGKLERGCYIIKLYGDTEMAACYNDITDTFHTDIGTYTTSVKEILARMPSYDEYLYLKTNNDHWKKEAIRISKQAIGIVLESDELVQKMHILEKQLAIATKALKEIDVRSQRDWNEYDCMGCARKALYDIEMEGMK